LQAAALAPGQPPTPDHAPPPGEGVTPPPPEPEEPTTAPETDPTPSGPLDERAQAAVEDLAERLGVDPEAIEVGPLEEVTWSDGSIGCPQPGQHYTQALEPGERKSTRLNSSHVKSSYDVFCLKKKKYRFT